MTSNWPKIIYGTAWKAERTASLVTAAVLQGFRAIDTAGQPKHYREELVGQALQTLYDKHGFRREDIFLQTKYTSVNGQDRRKPLPYDPSRPIREQVLTSFESSLRNLHTTYLDSYVLHSPLDTWQETVEAWKTLMTLQDEGRVRLIGLSNTYDVETLEGLSKERQVQVVQNRWFEGNKWDKSVCSYCKENGIMYQSFWTLSGSPNLLKHPALTSISSSKGWTPAQTLFKVAQANGITPLSGSQNKDHMLDGVKVEDLDMQSIAFGEHYEEVVRLLFQK